VGRRHHAAQGRRNFAGQTLAGQRRRRASAAGGQFDAGRRGDRPLAEEVHQVLAHANVERLEQGGRLGECQSLRVVADGQEVILAGKFGTARRRRRRRAEVKTGRWLGAGSRRSGQHVVQAVRGAETFRHFVVGQGPFQPPVFRAGHARQADVVGDDVGGGQSGRRDGRTRVAAQVRLVFIAAHQGDSGDGTFLLVSRGRTATSAQLGRRQAAAA
ncbi:hypothetical protein DAPPUDRAFT_119243, partial [Daphnia pulex]